MAGFFHLYFFINMKSLLAALLLLPLGVLPANADWRDSFDASRPIPNACFKANNKSNICHVHIDGSRYALGITDVNSDATVPSTFVLDCTTGKWVAHGTITQQAGNAIVKSFCSSV